MVRRNGPHAVTWIRRRVAAAIDLARRDQEAPPAAPAPTNRVPRLWSRLLANEEGRDDGDMIYEHLLAQLTAAEARILDYACRHSTKEVTAAGFIAARPFLCVFGRLREISGIDDLHQLDRDLDHLRSLELLSSAEGGFDAACRDRIANITPTTLALNLYVRCQGSTDTPLVHFGLAGSENAAASGSEHTD